jgi:putative ATP-binding cassette transporter
MTFENLNVQLPVGSVGLQRKEVVIRAGQHTLICGARGAGKTPLFRAVSGLWPWGSGRVVRPRGESVMYVPQGTPYLHLGTLREELAYPSVADRFTDRDYIQALERAGLERCTKSLDASERWDRELSADEQMALVLARVALQAPRWVVLDDTFSTMENGTLERAIQLFTQPGAATTVIHIGRSTQMHLPMFKQVLHLTRLQAADRKRTACS